MKCFTLLGWKCFQLLKLFENAKFALASTPLNLCLSPIFFFLFVVVLFCLTTVQNDRCGRGGERELGKYDNSHNWFPRFISSWFYIWSNCVVCWYSVGNRHEPYVSFAFINISIAQQRIWGKLNWLIFALHLKVGIFPSHIQKVIQSGQFGVFVYISRSPPL